MTKAVVFSCAHSDPDVSNERFDWMGKFLYDIKPDYVVDLGDGADMRSLNSFDGRKPQAVVSQNYERDIDHYNDAMERMRHEFVRNRRKRPAYYGFEGNHEHRIERAVENDSKLDGLLSYDDFELDEYGWEVYDFLEPALIDGIAYCHYFTSGVMGRPCASASLMLRKKHMSCIMGHVQDREIAYDRRADGSRITGLFGGIFYQHDEEYLNHQTNGSWRGVWMLHEVNDGQFDEMPVSMSYLEKKYGTNI